MVTYLLSRSRVTHIPEGERGYHIFYLMLSHLGAEGRDQPTGGEDEHIQKEKEERAREEMEREMEMEMENQKKEEGRKGEDTDPQEDVGEIEGLDSGEEVSEGEEGVVAGREEGSTGSDAAFYFGLKNDLKLLKAEDYDYLKGVDGKAVFLPSYKTDSAFFEEVKKAFLGLNLSSSEKLGIFQVLGAILEIGNIQIQPSQEDPEGKCTFSKVLFPSFLSFHLLLQLPSFISHSLLESLFSMFFSLSPA